MNLYFKKNLITIFAIICKPFKLDRKSGRIICFHSISSSGDKYTIPTALFKKNILELSKSFKFVSLDELLKKNSSKKEVISLTIDDGYRDARKIQNFLKNNNIPVTLFVVSNPNRVDRKELNNTKQLLSINEIKKLHKSGWTIGCHSDTHANFSNLSKEEIEKEVFLSKKKLEDELQTEIKYFAYPKGIFNNVLIKAVKKAGFKAALITKPGIITNKSDNYLLPRFVMEKNEIFAIPYSFTTAAERLRSIGGLFYAH